MVQRRGAIQMSLGLIVAVIFAVVFLSLAVVWVNDFMNQLTHVTEDLIKEGKTKIRETFSETDQKFDIYPKEWTLKRGEELKMVAGVINREPDSLPHSFVINVIPTKSETSSWIDNSEFNTPLTAQSGSILDFPITLTPPRTTPSGTYVFYVIACMDKSFGECSTPDDQNYESAQYVRLTLE